MDDRRQGAGGRREDAGCPGSGADGLAVRLSCVTLCHSLTHFQHLREVDHSFPEIEQGPEVLVLRGLVLVAGDRLELST